MSINFFCNIWKVQHGSAAFMQTPSRRNILFDAGRSDLFSPAKHLASRIPQLDAFILSHPHADHIQDLPNVLKHIKPKSIWRNKATPQQLVYPNGTTKLDDPLKSWEQLDRTYTATITEENSLTNSSYTAGVLFETFRNTEAHLKEISETCAANLNNYSLLSWVKYNDTEIVFPGDLEPDGWDAMLTNTSLANTVGKAKKRILIAPHHGRKSGVRRNGDVYSRFLELFQPNLVIISDKWGNETTDPEAYRSWVKDPLPVTTPTGITTPGVLTTKTNLCVSIQELHGNMEVFTYTNQP